MSKLKLGIVGAGGIFRYAHAKPWSIHPEVDMVAICDVNQEQAQIVAEEYGIQHVYSDYHQMLREQDLDVIDVCTPNVFHSEVALAALKAGKHVFCEKPDAVNPIEAQKMADAAQESGKLLMTMRNNRFTPASQFLRNYIQKGHMGEVYMARCGWQRRRFIPGMGGWFTTKSLSGGGPLIDLGVHFIDLAMWLMGDPKPVSVVGATYDKFGSRLLEEKNMKGTFDVEDLATGFIRFENGASLQIEFSWASNVEEEKNFLELRGTHAGAKMENGNLKLFSEIEDTLVDIVPRLEKDPGGHLSHIHHFVDCILHGAEPIIRPEHGVHMIQILSAIYESAETGSEVKLV